MRRTLRAVRVLENAGDIHRRCLAGSRRRERTFRPAATIHIPRAIHEGCLALVLGALKQVHEHEMSLEENVMFVAELARRTSLALVVDEHVEACLIQSTRTDSTQGGHDVMQVVLVLLRIAAVTGVNLHGREEAIHDLTSASGTSC